MVNLLGIDVGTSSTKVLVIDEKGNLLGSASSEYPISSPYPNWAEQNPEWWWNAVKSALRKISKISETILNDVIAIGLAGQMHGTVLLGKNLKPLRQAIIWADNRSILQCKEAYERIERENVIKISCNPFMPGFMATSLLWIKKNESSIFKNAYKVLLPKDYIRLKLTGSCSTDISDASATLLFDVKKRKWSSHIISALDLHEELLPQLFESTDVTGEVSFEASKETGIQEGIPIIAGGGDSPVGAMSCGAFKEGIVSSNIGTGGQVFTTINQPLVDPQLRVHTFCHVIPNRWYLQGAILSAGLSLKWFKINFAHLEEFVGKMCEIDPYELLSKEAELADPGCNGLVFLPYLLGERSPYMDPNAKGVFFGLKFSHNRSHIIRAILEGVVYALRDSIEIFKELGVEVGTVIARGGGSRSYLWRQIQADIFNAKTITVGVKEEVAFGAALLAGVGAGMYSNIEKACESMIDVCNEEIPNQKRVKIYDEYYHSIYSKIYPSFKKVGLLE